MFFTTFSQFHRVQFVTLVTLNVRTHEKTADGTLKGKERKDDIKRPEDLFSLVCSKVLITSYIFRSLYSTKQ